MPVSRVTDVGPAGSAAASAVQAELDALAAHVREPTRA